MPTGILSARPRALTPVPALVPRRSRLCVRRGRAAVLRRTRPPRRARSVLGVSRSRPRAGMGGLLQAALRWPRAQVLGYLARYTHRVAIGNSRLIELTD